MSVRSESLKDGRVIKDQVSDAAQQLPWRAAGLFAIAVGGVFWLIGSRVFDNRAVEPGAGWSYFALAALPTLAMGLQSATLRRVGHQGVRTTYVSGVLTNLAEAGVQLLFRRGEAHPTGPHEPGGTPAGRLRLYASLWSGYLVGAVMGSFGQYRWGFAVLALPMAGLGLVAARDLVYPRELGAAPEERAA